MGRGTPEVWMFVIFIIAIVVIPFIVGVMLVKVYRKFRPIEDVKGSNVAILQTHKHDGFFKILIIGWVICGPLFYLFNNAYLSN